MGNIIKKYAYIKITLVVEYSLIASLILLNGASKISPWG